jgi:hypothetical protein
VRITKTEGNLAVQARHTSHPGCTGLPRQQLAGTHGVCIQTRVRKMGPRRLRSRVSRFSKRTSRTRSRRRSRMIFRTCPQRFLSY